MSDESSTASDDRAHEALAHLQRATLELIEAARAMLDVAEEAVREPAGVMAVVAETLGALAATVPAWSDRTARPNPPGPAPGGDDPPRSGPPKAGAASSRRSGVEHIRIS